MLLFSRAKALNSPELGGVALGLFLAFFLYFASAIPTVTYVSPTLPDNATTGNTWAYVNFTSSEPLNQSFLEWGNSTGFTNVSMLNSSLTNWYVNMTGLADGAYNYTIWAENATGGWNQSERRSVYIDTTYPMSIANLSNQSQSDTWIYWNWTNPADFDHSEIYLNGTWKQNTSNNYYNATNLNASTWYQLQIRTVDALGNISATWVNSTARTLGDMAPPSITIVRPENKSYSYNQSLPLNFSLSEAGVWCGYSLDGAANATLSSCQNTTFNVSAGQHNLIVYANDSLGNMGSSQRYFTVDLAKPEIYFAPPTPLDGNIITNNQAYINVTATDAESHDNLAAFIDWNRSLVLWLRFDNSSGTSVQDYSSWNNGAALANMNSGVDNGTSGWTTKGMHGNAIMFDGTNDAVNITPSPLFDFISTDSFTIEFFVKTANCGGGTKVIFARKGLTGTWPDIYIACQSDWKIEFSVGDSNANRTLIKGQNISDNAWHHIAAKYDGRNSMAYLYIDGSSVNQSATSFTGNFTYPSGINPCVGAYRCSVPGSTYSFPGIVDDVKLWRRALSAEEINASYNAGSYWLYRNFTGLSSGNYTFTAHAEDISGNFNQTETRWVYVNYTPGYPKHSNISVNTTQRNSSALFTAYWTDDVGLSGYIFSTNNSGAWENYSSNFSGTGNWSNYTVTLNSTTGLEIGYIFYANNINSDWNTTGINTLVTGCLERWSYSNWSVCSGRTQTRTATDTNGCGTQINRSALSQPCTPITTNVDDGWLLVTRNKTNQAVANATVPANQNITNLTGHTEQIIQAKAKDKINEIKQKISESGTLAKQQLSEAEQAYSSGDYARAYELAVEAEKLIGASLEPEGSQTSYRALYPLSAIGLIILFVLFYGSKAAERRHAGWDAHSRERSMENIRKEIEEIRSKVGN